MVGKYMDLKDSYISLVEALQHGGIHTRTRVNIHYIESRDIEEQGVDCLQGMDGIVVPGGFGDRGIEGKIETVRSRARTAFRISASASACRWR